MAFKLQICHSVDWDTKERLMIHAIDILKNGMDKKASQQEKLSLRKMAAQLDISHSYLSLLLQGKRKLTKNLAVKFIEYFELDSDESEWVFFYVGNNLLPRKNIYAHERRVRLDSDVLKEMTIRHFAILTLVPVREGIRRETLLERLGPKFKDDLEDMILALIDFGMIKDLDGKLLRQNLDIGSGATPDAEQLQLQAMDMLKDLIEQRELRFFESTFTIMDPELLSDFEAEVNAAVYSLAKKYNNMSKSDEKKACFLSISSWEF